MTNTAKHTNPLKRTPLQTPLLNGRGHTKMQADTSHLPPLSPGSLRRSGWRPWYHEDHMMPRGRGERDDGTMRKRGNTETFNGHWPGTSIETERPRRRRRNLATWRKALRRERRTAVLHAELQEREWFFGQMRMAGLR